MNRYLISLLLLSAALGLAGCDGKSRSTSAWNDGDGSANKPYLIYTAEDLNAVRGNVAGYESWGLDRHYVLARDIDLSVYAGGAGWEPIGTQATPFTGVFDGNGRVISSLTINRPGSDFQGLFGYAGTAAVIKNVALSSVNVNGNYRVGSLVGYNNYGTIINSSATGTVSGSQYVGGLVGVDNGTIIDSHATVTVSGTTAGGLVGLLRGQIKNSFATGTVNGRASTAGGLVGYNESGTISTSYATGTVSAYATVGGLVGHSLHRGTISNSYATGAVSGHSYVGGLVGANIDVGTISTSYSAGTVSGVQYVGGLVGSNRGATSYSYWITDDVTLSLFGSGSCSTCAKLSDADGKKKTSFINWNFTSIWSIEEGVSYPELRPAYLIYTADDLNAVRGSVPGYEGWGLDKHYVLMQVIDLSGYAEGEGWVPIGTSTTPFTGVFDGNGKVISGLTINRPGSDYQGLFGYAGPDAVLKNAALSSVNVNGGSRTGSLAGYNNYGTIINSSATGTVSGSQYVGGLVGVDNGTISDSHASVTVTGGSDVGGLAAFSRGQIIKSYATGTVSGGNRIGGLVSQTTGTISDSYATGAVSGSGTVGGLVAYNNGGTISTSYSAGAVSGSSFAGGLVGRHDGNLIISSYWISDNTNSLPLLGVGGAGSADGNSNILSDTFGKQQASFIGWDFVNTWRIAEGVSYPELR